MASSENNKDIYVLDNAVKPSGLSLIKKKKPGRPRKKPLKKPLKRNGISENPLTKRTMWK